MVTFIDAYKQQKRKRALKIMNKPESPSYKISFSGNTLRKLVYARRRVGRPRQNWTEETVREVWDYIKKDDDRYRFTAFDGDNEEIISKLKTHAREQNPEP